MFHRVTVVLSQSCATSLIFPELNDICPQQETEGQCPLLADTHENGWILKTYHVQSSNCFRPQLSIDCGKEKGNLYNIFMANEETLYTLRYCSQVFSCNHCIHVFKYIYSLNLLAVHAFIKMTQA